MHICLVILSESLFLFENDIYDRQERDSSRGGHRQDGVDELGVKVRGVRLGYR